MEKEKHSKALDEMRDNSIFSQKRGIHFILALNRSSKNGQ